MFPMNFLQPVTTSAVSLQTVRGMVPSLFASAGTGAARRFIEFFTAAIRNRNTRAAYARAVARFARWCDAHHVALIGVMVYSFARVGAVIGGQVTSG